MATGFAPFNTAADVLSVAERPWALAFLPTVLPMIGSVFAAILLPSQAPRRLPHALVLGFALLVLGGVLSLGASAERTDSFVLLFQGSRRSVFAVSLLKSTFRADGIRHGIAAPRGLTFSLFGGSFLPPPSVTGHLPASRTLGRAAASGAFDRG